MSSRAKFDIQRTMRQANRALVREIRQVTGADSEAVRRAAGILARTWREGLGQVAPGLRQPLKASKNGRRRLRGDPSEPGKAPHRVTGRLQKSVRTAVVDGIRRVGTGDFRARLLEFGVVTEAEAPRATQYARFKMDKGGKTGRLIPRKRQGTTKGTRRLVIAPRPHARPALEACQDQMTAVVVAELSKSGGTA